MELLVFKAYNPQVSWQTGFTTTTQAANRAAAVDKPL